MVIILYTLDVHDENGVIGCRQLPNIEIERLDGDIFSTS
jgi:hypothetical protein